MPSRKKAKGKARKAAKAKEESRAVAAAGQRQVGSLEAQMQGLEINHQFTYVNCSHDWPSSLSVGEEKIYIDFIETFIDEFASKGLIGLVAAQAAANEKYPSLYPSKLDTVVSIILSYGTQMILEGKNDIAGLYAVLAFSFEDYMAALKTKGAPCLSKMLELHSADEHTLVSYYKKRTSCSCLDEKYKEVKSVKKMGWCYNKTCSHPGRKVERSKMFCCTRCGEANYCSVECQRADWKTHKMFCKIIAERTALNSNRS